MGLCRSIFRTSSYIFVALIAMLAYFHIQCEKEKAEKAQKSIFDGFNPEETDVKDVKLPFCQPGDKVTLDIGLSFILVQSVPCALMKLTQFVGIDLSLPRPPCERNASVTFYDARKKSPGDFHETGFTLITLEKEPLTKDWRTHLYSGNPDIKYFIDEMEPHLKRLYPDAKKILWTHNLVRGGDKFGDQPKAAAAPHLDFHQNKTLRLEYHNRVGPPMPEWMGNLNGGALTMGELDTDDSKFGILLGIWKPISPSKVCDYPLGLMDSRTFEFSHDIPMELSINLGAFTFYNLAGQIAYSPKQKWYYYPFMSTKEVLIFHQFSEGKSMANPHTAFFNKNCPKDTESRVSIEMRVALFF